MTRPRGEGGHWRSPWAGCCTGRRGSKEQGGEGRGPCWGAQTEPQASVIGDEISVPSSPGFRTRWQRAEDLE